MDLDNFTNYHVFDITTIVVGSLISVILWSRAKSKNSDQLRSYIPTLWTSLGIFFTFLSIYLSLSIYANEGKELDIKELISNIIPAFSTSIIGILGAIITTLFNRWSIANQEYKENEKFKEIKQQYCGRSNSDTPELMLLEIVKSIEDSGNKTCRKLDQGKNSSDNKLDSVIQQIVNVSGLITECKIETTKTIKDSQKEQKDFFIESAGELSKIFQETILATQNSFKSEIQSLQTLLEGKLQIMVNSNKDILERTVDLQGQKLEFIKDKLTEETKIRNEKLISHITEEGKRMQDFVTNQGYAYKELCSEINKQVSSHIDREAELFDTTIKQSIEEFAKAQYSTCVSTIKDSSGNFVRVSQGILQEQCEVNEKFIGGLDEKLTFTCNSLVEQFKILSQNMAGKLHEIQLGQADLIEKTISQNKNDIGSLLDANKTSVEEFLMSIKAQYSTCVSTIKDSSDNFVRVSQGILQEQCEVNEKFIGGLDEKLTFTCNSLVEQIKTLSQDMAGKLHEIQLGQADLIEKTISQNKNDIGSLLDANKTSVEEFLISIKTEYENIVGNLTGSHARLQQNYLDLSKKFTESIVNLNTDAKAGIKDLNTNILGIQESILSSFEGLQVKLDETMTSFEKQNATIKKYFLENTKNLSENIAGQIKGAFNINSLEDSCNRLNRLISETINAFQSKISIILDKLTLTSENVSRSAEMYEGAVSKSNEINKYIAGTADLFKLHSNELKCLQSSLQKVESSIEVLLDQILKMSPSSTNNRIDKSNSK